MARGHQARAQSDCKGFPLASVTGRIGYSWDRFLGYVKAGGAREESSYYPLFFVGES